MFGSCLVFKGRKNGRDCQTHEAGKPHRSQQAQAGPPAALAGVGGWAAPSGLATLARRARRLLALKAVRRQ